MSWWERQYKKFVVGGTAGVSDADSTTIKAEDLVSVEALGVILVTYEDEFLSHTGDPVYIENA
jgi:hypothetical protein